MLTQQKRNELLEANHKHMAYPGAMHFHPYSGICWTCGGDLVEYYGEKYATAEPTGCPYCNRSYCD